MPDDALPAGADDPDDTENPDAALADLAHLILALARLLRARSPQAPRVVPLTETERHVMRLVDLYPGTAPSEIARRARLQRTNVSTALRGLEAKGMVSRRATAGRGVAVRPTELASANLEVLRSAWSRDLAAVVGDDPAAVRSCVALLTRLEQRFTDDGPEAGGAAPGGG